MLREQSLTIHHINNSARITQPCFAACARLPCLFGFGLLILACPSSSALLLFSSYYLLVFVANFSSSLLLFVSSSYLLLRLPSSLILFYAWSLFIFSSPPLLLLSYALLLLSYSSLLIVFAVSLLASRVNKKPTGNLASANITRSLRRIVSVNVHASPQINANPGATKQGYLRHPWNHNMHKTTHGPKGDGTPNLSTESGNTVAPTKPRAPSQQIKHETYFCSFEKKVRDQNPPPPMINMGSGSVLATIPKT